jgi:SRSO17 transposase
MGRRRSGVGATVDVGTLEVQDVESLAERLVEFVRPYQEVVGWAPREKQLSAFVAGLLGGSERKSVEPIALSLGVDRRQLQYFVGVSSWDHEPLLGRVQHEVADEIGDPNGVIVMDGSAMPKKGTESVGVARQWCGRLGKVENCQLGVFLAYAGKDSSTLMDERLYLPRAWAEDEERRRKAKVPEAVSFKKPWELADEMLRHVGPRLPHRWAVGDAEYGRSTAFRDRLAKRGERYVLEVPSTIVVRKVARPKVGRPPTWHRVNYFLRRRDIREWQHFTVRDGQKEPIEVVAIALRVQTRRHGKPKEETLLAIEALGSKERWLFVSNAPRHTPLDELVKVASMRHLVEEAFENAKGEVGLDHHEVRAWRGWHHHMTASLMALWFLVRERRRLGKKSADLGGDGALHDLGAVAPAALTAGDRCALPLSDGAERGGAHQPLEGAWPDTPVVEARA